MGLLAFLLIAVGTVGAAIGVARTDPSVEGWVSAFQVSLPLRGLSIVLLVAGILVRRRSLRQASSATAKGGSLGEARAALQEMHGLTEALAAKLEKLDLDGLHAEIERIVSGPAVAFVDRRTVLSDSFGVAAYASVMGPFSQGERYLNRAWSASADGYLDEARACVGQALPQIGEARGLLEEL